jgi:succinoglycan biosynthesis transport protein ExoP
VNTNNPAFGNGNTPAGGSSAATAGKPQSRQRRHDDKPDIWRIAHRALRGRYRMALVLTLCGAIGGASLGVLSGQRLYRATGLVRIAAVRPQVLKETDQNQSIPMFDGVIEAQQEIMTGRETVEAAMRDETWRNAVRGHHDISEEQFSAALKVEIRHGSDHLRASYTDPDARISEAGVRSIITAYQHAYASEESRVERQRIDELQSRRTALELALKSVEEETGKLGNASDAAAAIASVDALYDAASERLKRLRAALVDVQCAIAGLPDLSHKAGGQPALPGEQVTTALMGAYIAQQGHDQMEVNRLNQNGVGKSHPALARAQAAVKDDQDRVAEYSKSLQQWRNLRLETASPEALKQQEATLIQLSAAADAEMTTLASQRSRLAKLQTRAGELTQSLIETGDRLDVLTTEDSLGSRLTIVSGGEKPLTAMLDTRPKTAFIGLVMGALSPLGVLICMVTFRRRYGSPIEVAEDLARRVPFVAVLPEIDADANTAAAAARALHQLRVRLQPSADSPCRAYLISSPAGGNGKSSIAHALGVSFAAAGIRTLLVDGDLVDRGLTRAFAAQGIAGFREAIHGQLANIRALSSGLYVLSAGQCRPQDAYTLTSPQVTQLLDRARREFNVVLIDSDPILDGVSAAVMAPHVDGVILTVIRNQSHGSVRESMRVLEQHGAIVAGCIFNRAKASDAIGQTPASPVNPAAVPELDGTSSLTGETAAVVEPTSTLAATEGLSRFGPIVAAVMSSLGLVHDTDFNLVAPSALKGKVDPTPGMSFDPSADYRTRVA